MGNNITRKNNARTEVELSVVIPIYNEATILESSVATLVTGLRKLGVAFEVILAENGSRDDTPGAIARCESAFEEVHGFHYPEPNYGGALREGIYRARGTYVLCEEIDLCDLTFAERALGILRNKEASFVVGSKAMRGARDHRPWKRRVATRVYNKMLRVAVGFRGTDTHGLKAFVRSDALPTVGACVVEYDVFASELVIRAERAGLRIMEIPVDVEEKRAPSVDLFKRVPRVVRHVAQLVTAVRWGKGS